MTQEKEPKKIRCAVYCRKSTEKGLEQEFNSLDNQRESCEAYIKSRQFENWVCLKSEYNDGGFSGGNADRPALIQLLANVEAGKVDCVVVYKVDRFSRSLIDFVKLLELLDKHEVSFVSVTQNFSTNDSMGRLTLNILLSFAQFERELSAERTKSKIAASRRKGLYLGGTPILGYDSDPQTKRLVVNQQEAEQVRAIFEIYLKHGSVLDSLRYMKEQGYRNKCWKTRKGRVRGGNRFSRSALYRFLTNPLYVGKVMYEGEAYPGQHDAIVSQHVFDRVQHQLVENGGGKESSLRNRSNALLKGMVHCVHCDSTMVHYYTKKKTGRMYRYYCCNKARAEGYHVCPKPSIAAEEIERVVVEQIKHVGSNSELQNAVVKKVVAHHMAERDELAKTKIALMNRHRHLVEERRGGFENNSSVRELMLIEEQTAAAETELNLVINKLNDLSAQAPSEDDIRSTLCSFEPVWDALEVFEKCRLIRLLIERVDFDSSSSKVILHFNKSGFGQFAKL